MQRLTGNGLAFIHAGGTLHRRTLEYREKLRVDTGCLVAMTRDIRYDIEYVGRMKTALFGGEGLFFATVEGRERCGFSPFPLAASPTGC